MQLLINHIGYERLGAKQAIIVNASSLTGRHADIVDGQTGQSVMQLPVIACGQVDQWHQGEFYRIDFSALTENGTYSVKIGDTTSPDFEIAEGILMQRTFSDALHYFKSQRCSGLFDQHDKKARLHGTDTDADVHGGWYDASGDVSKYLSHLSYANYLNPQQTPMIVWNMLCALDVLGEEVPPFTRTRLLDEALHGADFLARLQDPQGPFYMTVFDKWSKDPAQRTICAYETQDGIKTNAWQAGFRQGGGIAIAALAKSSTYAVAGEFSPSQYLEKAQTGYWHLKENNRAYLDDGKENIIDEYCALLAATELYKAIQDQAFLLEARYWANKLANRQRSDEVCTNFWSATEDGSRPYYHAAEAGLPAIALMQYLDVETEPAAQKDIQPVLLNALNFELDITREANNPFGYPRQYVKPVSGDKHTSFFIPHDNESGYWWQGENARLGSLAAMAYMASDKVGDPALKNRLREFGQHALDWVSGLNPFNMCMIDGHGYNNPEYLPDLGFSNAKGGICNGITSGFENERDIAFNPEPQKDDMLQNWRWGEQWIPHAGWFLLAIALQFRERKHD